MSKTVLVLFAACVGLSLLSLHLVKQMRAGEATITELQAQVAKLQNERQTAPPASAEMVTPAPTATWQVEHVAPAPATDDKETSKAAAAKPTAPPPSEPMFAGGPSREERMRMMRESRDRQRQLMQDPEYREAMRVQQRANIGRQYPGIGRELGLTSDQTEQLFDLLAEQQMRNNEQAQLMWDTDDPDPASMQQRQQKMQQHWMDVQKKNEAELAAHLGADKVQAWKDYQSTLAARHQAEQLRTTLAGRGVPLDDDASRAIVKAYAEAQKAEMQEYASMARTNGSSGRLAAVSMVTPRGLVGSGWSGPTQEMQDRQLENARKRNQRVLDALTPYLTYEQRETLQKEQEAELKMQEAHMRMMRAQSKVESNGNSGGNSAQLVIAPGQ